MATATAAGRISAGGSLYRVYHVCACEYRTYKWKKDGPGRPSPAANPLIYRLRVSACIRRLGHMPLPPPPPAATVAIAHPSSTPYHLLPPSFAPLVPVLVVLLPSTILQPSRHYTTPSLTTGASSLVVANPPNIPPPPRSSSKIPRESLYFTNSEDDEIR